MADQAAAKKTTTATTAKKTETVIKTILQVNGKDIDVSTLGADLLKKYKSVHKKKKVTEFVVYVKPEEDAAYFTVNGEGSEEFKADL